MFRIAIIDDEADARFIVSKSLKTHFLDEVDLIAEASSLATGLRLLSEQTFDLVFLDIQLGDGTGFDLLEKLPDYNFSIVFVTAYDKFALKAFEFFALSFLVKPFKTRDLLAVVRRYLKLQAPNEREALEMVKASFSYYGLEKLVIPNLSGFEVVDLSDIIYLQSDNNYSEIILSNDRRIVSSQTLKAYDKLLSSQGFFRCHQSYLINLNSVVTFSKSDGGIVRMKNGEEVPVGRRRQADFRRLFLS